MSFNFKVGDIALCNFPFVDKPEEKERPIVIIAVLDTVVWGLMLTSVFSNDDGYKYPLNKSDVSDERFLKKNSIIRYNVIQTIAKSKLSKPYCKLNTDCLDRILSYVGDILGFHDSNTEVY